MTNDLRLDTPDVACVVVGAGVVGLAIVRHLAVQGHEVLLLESQAAIGTGSSARNSEVIHADLYCPAESLKVQLCVSGNALLYAYCKQRHVPYRRCGKLIIACDHAQREQLDRLHHNAMANGAHRVVPLSEAHVRVRAPELRGGCSAGVHRHRHHR
nr:FAD-dependent oxidoreductase [Xanthomonas populi]